MRLDEKLSEIERYLSELEQIAPRTLRTYTQSIKSKAACEHYFEKIIESVVDAAFLAIREKKLRVPEEDKEAFDVLAEAGIISGELARKLKEAKGMRNIIAHEYGKIDDAIVFTSVVHELGRDTREFLAALRRP